MQRPPEGPGRRSTPTVFDDAPWPSLKEANDVKIRSERPIAFDRHAAA
jgi:hypothetical protein